MTILTSRPTELSIPAAMAALEHVEDLFEEQCNKGVEVSLALRFLIGAMQRMDENELILQRNDIVIRLAEVARYALP